LLHKYIKCKHQHSGRGLLLTISTSICKYLYAGEIRVKTHFKSMETHSSIQGRRHQPIRVQYSASHGFLGPLVQATDLDKSYYQWISEEGPPGSQPAKAGPIRSRS